MSDQEVRVNFRYSLVPDGNTAKDVMDQLEGSKRDSQATSDEAKKVSDENRLSLNKIIAGLNMDTSSLTGDDKTKADLTKFLSEQFTKIGDTMTKGVNMAFGVVEDIYKEMKRNSPLLQTLESLFNLAMQLFFMPLGNKLAEVLLPAVINLVETAAKLWDELGDGNLDQIFSKAITYGINALSSFFLNIGDALKGQGGMLGSIGNIMTGIGNFIKGPAFTIIETILGVVEFVIDNLKTIIAAIVAFKVASMTMSILTTQAIITGTAQGMGTSVGTAAGLAILAGGASMIGMGAAGFADGGIVPHTPGGKLVTVAENEDEVIMPKSKAGGMGGNVTNNFYGYTSDDIREMIDRSVSEKISISYIKGGY